MAPALAAAPLVVRIQGRPLVVHPLLLDLRDDVPGDLEPGQHLQLGFLQGPGAGRRAGSSGPNTGCRRPAG